jgi:electron transfer flavoprotein beta subunit
LKAKRTEIKEISNKELDISPENIGLDGSFTRVIKIFEPVTHEVGEVVDGTAEEIVDAIFRKLMECKVI